MNSAKSDILEPGLGTRNFQMMLRFSTFQEDILGYSWEPNSENCLDLNFVAPLVRKLSLYQIETISHLQSENSYCKYQVLVASKI